MAWLIHRAARQLRVSPLHMVLSAAALSNHGIAPPPRIATAVNTLEQGWVVLPALSQPFETLPPGAADEAALAFVKQGKPYWSHVGQASVNQTIVTWLTAGTLPDWRGTPLALAIALEENNIFLAEFTGVSIKDAGMNQ